MPLIPIHISALFIALVFALAFLILIAVYVSCKKAGLRLDIQQKYFFAAVFLILAWLTFTLIITNSGLLSQLASPYARMLLLLGPPVLLIVFLLFSPRFGALIKPIDNFWFIYLQSYRILREFILILLLRYAIIPQDLTFEGKNLDVLMGITAPFIAYYWFKKRAGYKQLALVWNIVGLGMLCYAIATTFFAHPFVSTEVQSNPLIFSFPFVWMPAFLSPFGILLHLLSLKKLLAKQQPTAP